MSRTVESIESDLTPVDIAPRSSDSTPIKRDQQPFSYRCAGIVSLGRR